MRCDVIVLLNLATMDSQKELDENRASLRRKYEARSVRCVLVDYPGQAIPNLKGMGSVGVYVLSHTKDVKADLAQKLWTELFAAGASVHKINIACCKGADGAGPMKPFCLGLVACQTADIKLREGLMVCGFTVNITTFETPSKFMDEEGKKFENYDQLKGEAEQRGRNVATVKQAWAPRDSGGPNTLSFVHDKMGQGQTPKFIEEAEALFREQIKAYWNDKRQDFIASKFNPNKKAAQKIEDPTIWSWLDFLGTHPEDAKRFVKLFWPEFLRTISSVNNRSAAMWSSLDGYMRMKSAMRFDGRSFAPIGLSAYADNPDMKSALSFVETANKSQGVTLRCFID